MDFPKVVLLGAGVFGLKMFAVHFLSVRRRIVAKDAAHPEDAESTVYEGLMTVFKPLMGAYGPALVSDERLQTYARNCVQHELPVLTVALAAAPLGPPAWMGTALAVFIGGRVAHGVFFLTGSQPFRTLAYLPTFAAMGALSVGAIVMATGR